MIESQDDKCKTIDDAGHYTGMLIIMQFINQVVIQGNITSQYALH